MKRFLPLFFWPTLQKKRRKVCKFRKTLYLCIAFEKQSLLKEVWKGGRVVDYSGLENRRAERHRGFESFPRKEQKVVKFLITFFVFCKSQSTKWQILRNKVRIGFFNNGYTLKKPSR